MGGDLSPHGLDGMRSFHLACPPAIETGEAVAPACPGELLCGFRQQGEECEAGFRAKPPGTAIGPR